MKFHEKISKSKTTTMKHLIVLSALFVSLIFSACESKNSDRDFIADGENLSGYQNQPGTLNEQNVTDKTRKETQTDGNEVSSVNITERKLIKQGTIKFETKDPGATKEIISGAVKEFNGYISSDNIQSSKSNIVHKVQIRVPAENFDLLLNRITESADKLDSKNIRVLDVTEEFIDVEARIKTKKELEARYKEILTQAKTVAEILSIEEEIGKLRTEIESAEGRLKYLRNQIGYGTLIVEFYETPGTSFGFFDKLFNALEKGWEGFLTFIIGLVYIWPFILILIGIIFILVRFFKKRKKKVKA
jgi:hypothetical protein